LAVILSAENYIIPRLII